MFAAQTAPPHKSDGKQDGQREEATARDATSPKSREQQSEKKKKKKESMHTFAFQRGNVSISVRRKKKLYLDLNKK